MSLEGYKNRCLHRVNAMLQTVLPRQNPVNTTVIAAMRYSVLNGGKRIRPLLSYAACEAVGGHLEDADPAACAVELIHAYSLVHDDLPAMDDDDLRRGKPTCHKAYNEAIATLAGDALQTLAFELLSSPELLAETRLSASQRLLLIEVLAQASGHAGMVGGQAMDLESTGLALRQDQLVTMHNHKTGALIRAAIKMGALSHADVAPWQLAKLDQYASAIGLAFQVQDDILDVTADTQILGKRQGADQALDKPTYVSIMGLKQARSYAQTLCQRAITAITEFDNAARPLRQLAEYIVQRTH